MKQVFLGLLVAFLLPAQAQHFDVYGFSGFTFGDRFPIFGGDAKIFEGHTYGGGLSYALSDYYEIDFTYSRQDSRVTAFSSFANVDVDEDVVVNYFLIGGHRMLPLGEAVSTYGGLKAGWVTFGSPQNNFDNITRFAVGLNAGAKLMLSEVIGFRLNASLNLPVSDVDTELWWSSGSGTNVGLSSSTPFAQFGLTGGLLVRI